MDIAINVVSSVRLAFQPLTILRASTSARNTRMLNSNAKYAEGYGRTVKKSVGLYKRLKLSISLLETFVNLRPIYNHF